MSDTPHIFGLSLLRASSADVEEHLERWLLQDEGPTTIATVNPEMLLQAHEDTAVYAALEACTVRLPDGVGVSVACAMTGQRWIPRHPGVDVFVDLCRQSAKHGLHVVVVGGWGSDPKRAADVLRAAFPGLRLSLYADVNILWEDGVWKQPPDLVSSLADLQPDVLAVALGGGGPNRQERWLATFAPAIPNLRVGIGIGGSLDMISGRIPRAPRPVRALGLEWAWRLAREPRRAGRIYRAVILFPWLVLLDRMRAHESSR